MENLLVNIARPTGWRACLWYGLPEQGTQRMLRRKCKGVNSAFERRSRCKSWCRGKV